MITNDPCRRIVIENDQWFSFNFTIWKIYAAISGEYNKTHQVILQECRPLVLYFTRWNHDHRSVLKLDSIWNIKNIFFDADYRVDLIHFKIFNELFAIFQIFDGYPRVWWAPITEPFYTVLELWKNEVKSFENYFFFNSL